MSKCIFFGLVSHYLSFCKNLSMVVAPLTGFFGGQGDIFVGLLVCKCI